LAQEVARLQTAINGTVDRSTRLEGLIKELQQLVIVHDDVIKKKVLGANGGSGCGGSDAKRMDDMMKELQKLVISHDEILREMLKQRGATMPLGPPCHPSPWRRFPRTTDLVSDSRFSPRLSLRQGGL